VLALQGDVREHIRLLERAGARAFGIRRESELDALDGLVLPGGESTTIVKLARHFDLYEPLRKRLDDGLPAYGSCAGMILLADRILDGIDGQDTFGGIDVTVRRNAFGRQVDSFEEPIDFDGIEGEPLSAVFIRAPWVEEVGPAARVLATVHTAPATSPSGSASEAAGSANSRIVAIRQKNLLATSFHPELTDDARVHEYFVRMVKESIS